jgi:DNA-binding transcriptional MerR regulator
MGKTLNISKVASLLGESSYILKMWELEFSAYLEIERDHKNARVYSPENIEVLRKIKHLKDSQLDHETIIQMLNMNGKSEAAAAKADTDIELSAKKNIKVALEEIFNLIEEKGKQDISILELKMDQLELTLIDEMKRTVKQELDVHSKTQLSAAKGQFSALHNKINEQSKVQLSAAKGQFSALHKKLNEQSYAQLSASEGQFSALHDKLDVIHETSSNERDMYQEEIRYERELAKKHIEIREQKFLAFVQQHQKSRDERKYGLSMLKQFIGFAK